MKKALSILLSVMLLFSLAACGAQASDTAMNGASADKNTSSAAPSMPMPAPEVGFDYAMPEETVSDSVSASGGTTTVSSTLPENVKMIYRGYLYLESTGFDAAVSGLEQLVAEMGGYFESSELNNYSPYRNAYYVVRVPSAQYQPFCGRVGQLAQVNSQRHTTENVSEAYYDTESRLVTQRTKLERLQELLAKADVMEDIITLESAIAETELQIERLTGTLRKYDALVDYATVEINLEEVYELTEQEQPVIGFGAKLVEAFKTGTNNFVDDLERFALRFARNWISRTISLVFWIVVIVIVVRLLRKKKDFSIFRRKKKEQAPPPPPANDKPEEK
ncbi:MAG: DUF4349 domain-containing protein [Clostridia bacterium]|nr:DUF4349 domain-containing protein [Clostridia bacterium]